MAKLLVKQCVTTSTLLVRKRSICYFYSQTIRLKSNNGYFDDFYHAPLSDNIDNKTVGFVDNSNNKNSNESTWTKDDFSLNSVPYETKGHYQYVSSLLKQNKAIPTRFLLSFPLTSLDCYMQHDFLENFSLLWFDQLQLKLSTAEKGDFYWSDLLKGCFFALGKFNNLSTNFDWSKIEFIADKILLNVCEISPQNFDRFLKCLYKIMKLYQLNDEKLDEINGKLKCAFELYLTGILDEKVQYFEKAEVTICHTVFLLNCRFGINVLSTNSLRNLINIYGKILRYRKFRSSFDYFKTLHYMAEPFVNWNFDPILHDNNFWILWYSNVFKFYRPFENYSDNQGIFHMFILLDCVKVALKFDQEIPFLTGLPLWLDGMLINKRLISENNRCMLYEQICAKYLNNNYHGVLDEITVSKLLKCFK